MTGLLVAVAHPALIDQSDQKSCKKLYNITFLSFNTFNQAFRAYITWIPDTALTIFMKFKCKGFMFSHVHFIKLNPSPQTKYNRVTINVATSVLKFKHKSTYVKLGWLLNRPYFKCLAFVWSTFLDTGNVWPGFRESPAWRKLLEKVKNHLESKNLCFEYCSILKDTGAVVA